MFKISWRNRSNSLRIIEGNSLFPSFYDALRQVNRWRKFFPQNSYYIVKV